MNEDDYSFLNFCEQWYYTCGKLPTLQQSMSVGHNKSTWNRCLKLPIFNKALEGRGITPFSSFDSDGNVPATLSSEQLNAASVMLDIRDGRPQKKKLTDLGIATQKWDTWLRDPIFQQYVMTRAEHLLGSNGHEAHTALLERVRAGELGAIKYFNEITGRYIPERTKGVDVQSIILRVIEIIQIHVADPTTQSKIADSLLEIVKETSAQYNGQPVVRPAIKRPPARQIEAKVVKTAQQEIAELELAQRKAGTYVELSGLDAM